MKREPYEDEDYAESEGCSACFAVIIITIVIAASVIYLFTHL